MPDQLITEADIAAIFKNNETQIHHKVDETERVVIDNIDKLEYYKGYAKGMNGLIEKVEANTGLDHVIKEVQMLANQHNLLNNKNDYTASYPNSQENPFFLQGQIKGITDSVQTLRGIDITKYVENLPTTKQTLPEYPALPNEDRKEHSEFVNVVHKNCPTANIEDLNRLCIIANDMTKLTVQNTNGTLSNERFNSLTDKQEVEIDKILKTLPGVTRSLDYEPRGAAIKLHFPQGQTNNFGGYAVPELSQQKLTPSQNNEFATPFINVKTKNQSR